MKANEYSRLLSSWLRIPKNEIDDIINIMQKESLLPLKSKHITSLNSVEILLSVMVSSFFYKTDITEWIKETISLSLQSQPDTDPLAIQKRTPFMNLVAQSAGQKSKNGYVNISETINKAFSNFEKNIGIVELHEVSIETWGRILVGKIKIYYDNEFFTYMYSSNGLLVEEEGIHQKISVGRAVLNGIGWTMEAEKKIIS